MTITRSSTMDTFLSAQESSFTDLHLEVPDSPPHATPACDPLPCLTSLCHSLLLSGALNLPSAFCQGLLLHPPGVQSEDSGEERSTDGGVGPGADGIPDAIVEGFPVHPLYVQLAAALYRWIRGRLFPRNLAPIAGINEDESWKLRLDAWTDTVVTQGSALLEVVGSPL